jgi:thermitase
MHNGEKIPYAALFGFLVVLGVATTSAAAIQQEGLNVIATQNKTASIILAVSAQGATHASPNSQSTPSTITVQSSTEAPATTVSNSKSNGKKSTATTDADAAAAALADSKPTSTTTGDFKFVTGQILVKFKDGTSQADQDAALKANNASIKSAIPHIGVNIAKVPAGAEQKVAAALAHNPNVQFAEVDGLTPPTLTPNDPYYANWTWYLKAIHTPLAWDTTTGTGATIAVLDSAIDSNHPDLAANMVPGYNFIKNSTDTVTYTGCPHGTTVAGAAAAVGNNATGTVGVAFSSKIMPLIIADGSTGCLGMWSAMASSITYAADHGVRIINISYGGVGTQYFDSATQSAITYAWNKGAIVFASAGNNTTDIVTYPAADQNAVGVAATDVSGNAAVFSNYGNWVSLSAPGQGIFTTDYEGTPGYISGDYTSAAGTSYASPIAAGVAALVFAANPSLTNVQALNILKQTADDFGMPGTDPYYGAGQVNAVRAVSAALGTTYQDTVPPTITYTSGNNGQGVMIFSLTNNSVQDNVGISKVELYKDGALYANGNLPALFAWDMTKEVNGSSHTFQAKAYDYSGNVALSSISTYKVDNVPPTISFTNPTNGASVSGAVTLSVNTSDADSGINYVSYRLDNSQLNNAPIAPYSLNWNSASTTDGTHYVSAIAYDRAGNTTTVTIPVTTQNGTPADTAAPTNPGFYRPLQPTIGTIVWGTYNIVANANDNVGIVKMEIYKDNQLFATVTSMGGQSCPVIYPFWCASWDTTKEGNGAHTLMVKAYDAAGNVAASTAYPVTVQNPYLTSDTAAPSIPQNLAGVAASTNQINLSWSASTDNAAVAGYNVYRNGAKISSVTTTSYADVGLAASTTYAYAVAAFDAAGNTSAQSAAVTVSTGGSLADTSAPVTAITLPVNGATISGTVAVAATASDNVGVTKVEFYKDGSLVGTSTSTPYSFNWVTTTAANGAHTLQTKSYDAAGNVGASTLISVMVQNTVVDTTAPVTAITSPINGATVNSTVGVSASASDNVAVTKAELYVDGVLASTMTASPYLFSWDTTKVANGSHTLQTKAYDAAGNVGTSAAIGVNVSNVVVSDVTAPALTITSPKSGAKLKTSGNTSLAASASDPSSIASIVISFDGIVKKTCTLATSCSYSLSNKTVTTGTHTVTVTATDNSVNHNVATASVGVSK